MQLVPRLVAPLALVVFGALGCHGAASPPPLPAPPDGQGIQLEMSSALDAGQEIERCRFFVSPPGGLVVNHASVRYTAGSHHVLVFTTSYSAVPTMDRNGMPHDTTGIFDCALGAPADWLVEGMLAGAQSSEAPDLLSLPPEAAVKVPAGAVLLMNTHYLNATTRPVTTDARINLYTVPESQVKYEAGLFFFYDPFIYLAPMSSGSARMRCPITKDITIVNLQSHMHRRGLGAVVNLVDAQGANLELMYTSSSWENVFVKQWTGGKQLAAGTAVDYRCDYKNDETRTIGQGLTTKDEMCALLAAYYPRDRSLELCASQPSFTALSTAATYIGGGTANCLDTLLCGQAAKSAVDFYGCVVNSCPENSVQISAGLHCQATMSRTTCSSQCGPGGTGCVDCLRMACKAELDACTAARCN
jgi:hypothetical protein